MSKTSEKILCVAVFAMIGGITIVVYCIGVIHGTIYGLLTAGISLFLIGIAIGLFPWEEK